VYIFISIKETLFVLRNAVIAVPGQFSDMTKTKEQHDDSILSSKPIKFDRMTVFE